MGARPPRPGAAVAAALALGAALRGVSFLERPSLAMDEARLSLNIAARSFAGLAAPLDHDQSAPLLFLWAERLMTRLFGVNEPALRALPLLSGLGVLLVSFVILRRLVPGRSTTLGVAILAVAPTMVAYSNEAKQYMTEALVALVLVWLALEWLERPGPRPALLLAVTGIVAVWLSGSAVLVLAGIAPVVLFGHRPMDRATRRLGMAACAAWAVWFGLAYLLVYRSAAVNPYMERYWAPAFLTPGDTSLRHAWLALEDIVWGFIVGHGGLARKPEAEVLVAACAVIGLGCVLWGARQLRQSRGPGAAAVLLGPLAAVLLASLAGLYPVGQRLLVFAVPSIVILGVAGLEAAVGHAGTDWGRRTWGVLAGLVVAPLFAVTVLQLTVLDSASRMRGLVARLASHRAAGEPVYVFGRALPAWEFYTTNWSAPDRQRLDFLNRVARAGGPAFENAPSRGGRVGATEGEGLRYRAAAGPELIGLPTGMEYVAGQGLLRLRPDDGWVEREADRIEGAAGPGVWIVLAEFLGPEYQLVEELRRRGARITYGDFEPGHVLVRIVFASSQHTPARPMPANPSHT